MHYHAQTGRPFFLGCYTNADASTTLDQCRAFYAACGQAADIVTITTVHGSGQYNKWCPCFDTLTQSNVKAGAAPYYTRPAFLEAVAAATSSPSPQPSPPPLSSPPLPQPPSPPAASSSLSAAPNFLLIQPDDLPFHWPEHAPLAPPDMGATPALALPNIARLAAEGATFSRAYASSPMCAPSRYGLLTGRHPSRGTYAQQSTIDNCGAGSTVTDVVVPKTKLDLDLSSNVQTLLRDGGYRTGIVGKWHLSSGTSEWADYEADRAKATATGFDAAEAFYIGNMNNNAALPFSHNQEWVTAEALAFVRGASPWFLYMNPTAPHSPSVQEALENYNLTATPQGTLASPPDAGTTPSRADLWSRATTARPNKGAAKVAGALWVDDAVGAMLGELQTLGSLDQTLVIFSMDHGMKAKGALWEQGTRIALFVRYPPAFAAGAVIGGAVSNIDVRRATRTCTRTRTCTCTCTRTCTRTCTCTHTRTRTRTCTCTCTRLLDDHREAADSALRLESLLKHLGARDAARVGRDDHAVLEVARDEVRDSDRPGEEVVHGRARPEEALGCRRHDRFAGGARRVAGGRAVVRDRIGHACTHA